MAYSFGQQRSISRTAEIKWFLKYKSQDVYTDQWTVLIFYIFRMYKNYLCEIMRPPSSEAPVQVNGNRNFRS